MRLSKPQGDLLADIGRLDRDSKATIHAMPTGYKGATWQALRDRELITLHATGVELTPEGKRQAQIQIEKRDEHSTTYTLYYESDLYATFPEYGHAGEYQLDDRDRDDDPGQHRDNYSRLYDTGRAALTAIEADRRHRAKNGRTNHNDYDHYSVNVEAPAEDYGTDAYSLMLDVDHDPRRYANLYDIVEFYPTTGPNRARYVICQIVYVTPSRRFAEPYAELAEITMHGSPSRDGRRRHQINLEYLWRLDVRERFVVKKDYRRAPRKLTDLAAYYTDVLPLDES